MRQTNTRTVAEQKPLGVIESVSAGLGLVWRRPWTLLVPIVLDVVLWILPRLSLAEMFRPYMRQILNVAALQTDPQVAEGTRRSLEQAIEAFNVLGIVATMLNAVTRLPTLLAVDAADVPSPVPAWTSSIPVLEPAVFLFLFVSFFLLGLFFVALYLEWIAQGVRPLETPVAGASLLRVAKLWLRLILFAALLAGFLSGAVLVLLLLTAVFNSPGFAGFVMLLITVGLFWVFIYFFFVPSAAAVSDIGVREALKRSTLLFRAFFWSTLGLVALSVFLDRGMAIIWDGFTVSTFGVVIGIVANAFIGTALLAASMVYYQDRLNAFERMRQAVKPTKK